MEICPCSPDVGDCPRCKKKHWIRDVVSHMTTNKFAKHPKKYTLKTRRRAQFLKNIRRPTRKNSRKG